MEEQPDQVTAVEVYRRYNEAENRHDFVATTALLSPQLDVRMNGRRAVASAEEDRVAMSALLGRFPDYRREIDEILGVDDRAVVRWRMVGTSVNVACPDLDLPGCSIVRSENGLLTEAWLYFDGSAIADLLASLDGS